MKASHHTCLMYYSTYSTLVKQGTIRWCTMCVPLRTPNINYKTYSLRKTTRRRRRW